MNGDRENPVHLTQPLTAAWVLLVTAGLLVGTHRASAADDIGQRWAVLIGVNDYAELQDLQFCKNDVTALATALTKSGFAQSNVFVLNDGAADVKDLPTKGNIEARIKNVLSVASEGDLVLIAFNGHGMSLSGRTYLCPMEARENDPEGTMIPLLAVYDALRQSQARFKLMLVDACRNDALPAGSRSASAIVESRDRFLAELRAVPKGIATLASCAEGQKAWEEPSLNHGVFTHYLLEGLAGKADQEQRGNRDGRVSLLELFNYTNFNTKLYVLREKDRVQTPVFFGEIAGDFDLVSQSGVITNSIGMKLVLIPTGEFLMGSPEDEEGRAANEGPQHRVRITKPFYLGMHEVTLGQFRQFVEAKTYRTEAERDGQGGWAPNPAENVSEQGKQYNWQNPNFAQRDDHPVVNVTWNDATAFCDWLSSREGRRYELPTEAQWEYACRSGTTTLFAFGLQISPETGANCGNGFTLVDGENGRTLKATTPVGSYRANGWRLYDMHGNVSEWCADWYGEDYYGNSPLEDPTGPTTGQWRVVRNGPWGLGPDVSRSASRRSFPPDKQFYNLGFRVASAVEE